MERSAQKCTRLCKNRLRQKNPGGPTTAAYEVSSTVIYNTADMTIDGF